MVDFKISKLFKKEEPILHEKGFTIEKDVLFYRDSFILIRNISQVSVGPLPTPEFPKVAILMILIGLVLISCYHWAYTSYFGMHINLQLVSRSAI